MGNFDAPSWPFEHIQPSRAYQISYSLYCVDRICPPSPPRPPPPHSLKPQQNYTPLKPKFSN